MLRNFSHPPQILLMVQPFALLWCNSKRVAGSEMVVRQEGVALALLFVGRALEAAQRVALDFTWRALP